MNKDPKADHKSDHQETKQGASTPGGKQQAETPSKESRADNRSRDDLHNEQSAAASSAAATGRNRSAGARGDANQHQADNIQGNLKARAETHGDGESHGGKSR